jgi:hypothetical protein
MTTETMLPIPGLRAETADEVRAARAAQQKAAREAIEAEGRAIRAARRASLLRLADD